MPTIALGTAECACGGTIVLRLEEHLDGDTRKYAYCKECGLVYWPDTIRARKDFKDNFPKQPNKPPDGPHT